MNLKPPLWAPGIVESHPFARGLIGCWPLWDGGGTQAMDLASDRDPAVFVSSPLWVPQGVEFDGTNYLREANHACAARLNGLREFTFLAVATVQSGELGTFDGEIRVSDITFGGGERLQCIVQRLDVRFQGRSLECAEASPQGRDFRDGVVQHRGGRDDVAE